jgi:hypothetical protein
VGTYIPTAAYSYITINAAQTLSNISLYSNSIFYSIPFTTTGITDNALAVTAGQDASATLTRTSGATASAAQVAYITIPNRELFHATDQ